MPLNPQGKFFKKHVGMTIFLDYIHGLIYTQITLQQIFCIFG